MKKFIVLLGLFYLAVLCLSVPLAAHGALVSGSPVACNYNSLGNINDILSESPEFRSFAVGTEREPGVAAMVCVAWTVLEFMIKFGVALAVIFIMIAGYQYMLSGGDENAMASAKKRLLWAVIGFALVLLAFPLVNFLFQFFGPFRSV